MSISAEVPGQSPAAVFQHNPQFPPPQPVDDDDERPAPNVPVAVPGGQRGPVFNSFPQPQNGNPQAMPPAQPGAQPQMPNVPATSPMPVAPYGGVAVPGMVAPPPQPQPGQVPGQVPPQGPIRRPGGPGGQ